MAVTRPPALPTDKPVSPLARLHRERTVIMGELAVLNVSVARLRQAENAEAAVHLEFADGVGWIVRGRGVTALEDQRLILVVEDDQEIQSIVEDALTDGGYVPAIAPSGEEAVTLLKGNRGKYRALIADIGLRGRMTGWEVASCAREIDPEFPVLYLTGAFAHQWALRGSPTASF